MPDPELFQYAVYATLAGAVFTRALAADHVVQLPVIHFGDLDPNGVRICLHLRERRPDLRWFVPAFWAESVESHGLRTPWPADLDLSDAPSLVRNPAARGLWLEQERIVLDHRLREALESTAHAKAGEDPG